MNKKNKAVTAWSIGIALLCMCQSINVQAAPLQETTGQYQYDIGSVSKTVTSVAVMQLVDEGKIDLDEPLITYIPDFQMEDERYKDITPRMLLNHTSGIMGCFYHNGTLFESENSYNHDHLLLDLAGQTLKSTPGEYAVYCNDGFTLAEILVERVSKMSFTEYMEENICKPLDMENTTTSFSTKEIQVPIAKNYLNHLAEIPYESQSEVGSGGIKSTTEDLCKLATVFMKNGSPILSKKSAKEMYNNEYADTTYLNVEGDNMMAFGLGFDAICNYPFNKYEIQAVSKGGDLSNQHANLTIIPEENMAAAVLSSGGNSTYDSLVAQAVLMAALEVKGVMEAVGDDITAESVAKEYSLLETCKIPRELLEFSGVYAGGKCVEVSFPDDSTLRLTTIDVDNPIVQDYVYTDSGWFVGTLGGYLMMEPYVAANGINGVSKIQLREEADGRRYICYNSYITQAGLGTSALADTLAEKVEKNPLNESVQKVWDNREEKEYYLFNENYASTAWMDAKGCSLKVKEAMEGYISSYGLMRCQKILDENHSETANLCRDMGTVTFSNSQGIELMSLDYVGSVYVGEEALSPLSEQSIEITMDQAEAAKWYTIPENLTKAQAEITVSGKGAVFVYDKYHKCIYSTMILDGGSGVVLPEQGTVAFAGEKGCQMQLHYK